MCWCVAKFSLSLLNRHKLLRFGLFELFKIGSDLILRFFFSGSCWQIVADRNCCWLITPVWHCGQTGFLKKFKIFLFLFFAKIECGLYFLDCFDVLMSKIILKK